MNDLMSVLSGKRGRDDPYNRFPRSILPYWWNADDHASAELMTDDGAGLISSVRDRVGKVPVAATTTARPTWGSTWTGSRSSIVYDGVANTLTAAGGVPSTFPTGALPSTIVTVGYPTFVGSTSLVSYGAATANRRMIGQDATGKLLVGDGNNSFAAGMCVIGPSVWNYPAITVGLYGPTQVTAYQNGTIVGPSNTGVLATVTTRFRHGSRSGPTADNFWGGAIRHILVFSTLLNTADRLWIEGWLAWDSGLQASLPSTHPYRNATF